jgi:anti-sigma regulatory factor (Ser/Thr protein kinase)
MGRLTWPVRPLPAGHGEPWHRDLEDVSELPAARAGLRDHLAALGLPRDGEDPVADRLVLAFEELASNALRHGQRPVVATVVAGTGGFLLDVSDRGADTSPTPAVDRDPAEGGLGLYMVARLSVAHGWYVTQGCKHVWACLPLTSEDPTATSA